LEEAEFDRSKSAGVNRANGQKFLQQLSDAELAQLDEVEPEHFRGGGDRPGPGSGSKKKRQAHEQKRIQRLRNKNTVNFKYEVKLARIPEKNDWGTWLTGIF